MRPIAYAPLVLSALWSVTAAATEPFTANTLAPYLNNEVNGLELNHIFLQSMLTLDATPFTVGAGVRASPLSYQRIDGGRTDAGLGKVLYVISIGAGKPRSGVAVFGGVNVSQVRPSGFPNITALSGDQKTLIRA